MIKRRIPDHLTENKTNFIQFYHKRCKRKAALWSVHGFLCQLFFLRRNKVALRTTTVMMVLLVSSRGLKQHEDTRKLWWFSQTEFPESPSRRDWRLFSRWFPSRAGKMS